MRKLEYSVADDGYINRFITAGLFTCPRNAFIEQRDKYPPEYIDLCSAVPGEEIEIWGQKREAEIYFPFENKGYGNPGSYHSQGGLRTYCGINLEADTEEAPFEIETCGSVTLWNNDSLITDFTSFTENNVQKIEMRIPLIKGENRIVLCLDHLADRDADHYFCFRYKGRQALKMILHVPLETDIESLKRYEAILSYAFLEKETCIDEPVILLLPFQLIKNDVMKCAVKKDELGKSRGNRRRQQCQREYRLQFHQRRAKIFSPEDLSPGYYHLEIGFQSGAVKINRRLGIQMVWKNFLYKGPDDVSMRKKVLLDTLIRYGAEDAYKAAAFLKTGKRQEKAEKFLLEALREVDTFQERIDTLAMILYLAYKFRNRLSAQLIQRIRELTENYCCRINGHREEKEKAYSESDTLLLAICRYIGAALFNDSFETWDKGNEIRKEERAFLERWFERFFQGFIPEWNSDSCISADVLGLAILFDLTDEKDQLHAMAQKGLDMISFSLAVAGHKGTVMTSFGRTYGKDLKGNYSGGTTSILYVLFNAGFLSGDVSGSVALALGDYEAPEDCRKYSGLGERETLIWENTQGGENPVNLYFYKTKDVLLSTAVMFRSFSKGGCEHICQASIDQRAQIFINHPRGTRPYWESGCWAGNGVLPLAVQYRNLAILVYDIPEDDKIDYTHAYVPLNEFQEYRGEDSIIVLKKGDGSIGISTAGKLSMVQSGPCAYREFINRGRKNIWVIKVESGCRDTDLDLFLEEMKKIRICCDHNGVTVVDGDTIYFAGYNHIFLVNGKRVYNYPMTARGNIRIERK